MKPLNNVFTNLVAASICMLASATTATWADSPAELLEKAIYNEDTVGNLDEAIKIYRQVVAEAGETQKVAAKAQYRLGLCLKKQGNDAGAQQAFEALVKDFPKQKDLVALAKQQLGTEALFTTTPWKDGERLTMKMMLPGGRVIGLIGLAVEKGELDGRNVWDMTIRRFVMGGQNQGVSKVYVDRTSFRPLRTDFDHTLLGTASGKWTDEKIELSLKRVNGKDRKTEVELSSLAYSNDQVFYGFRQLPLEVGYETTIPIRVAFTGGSALGLKVEVADKETVKTPAGTFEAFRIETNIQQTFWVADTPERYVVQFEAEGIVSQLDSISHEKKPTTYEDDKVGYSCEIPEGWFFIKRTSSNDETEGSMHLVAPTMASAGLFVKDMALLDKGDRSNETWMKSKLKRLSKSMKDFDKTEEDVSTVTLGEGEGLHVTADHEINKRPIRFSMTLGIQDGKAVQLITNCDPDQHQAVAPQFDAIRKSIRLR